MLDLITWLHFSDVKLRLKIKYECVVCVHVCACAYVLKRPEQCLALTEAAHKSGVNRDLGACHLHWGGSETYSLRANQAQSGPQRTLRTADQALTTTPNTKQVLSCSSPKFLLICHSFMCPWPRGWFPSQSWFMVRVVFQKKCKK